MTENEICVMYREAKDRFVQLQILADLNGISRNRIIGILVRNGEKLPPRATRQLFKRMSDLEAQISEREKEYREIAEALNGGREQNGGERNGIRV